jgi:signal recognition particle subunit SRP54
MVLNALGQQLSAALERLNKATTVDDETLKAVVKDISNALLQSDVAMGLVVKLRQNVLSKISAPQSQAEGFNRARLVEKAVVDELVTMLSPTGKEPFKLKKGKSNVVMFVGLQGAGKTTTVAKYAHYYQQRKWKVAMVCADTFRAGAFDQLKQNATRVRVPFYGSYAETDPVKVASEGVEQFRSEGYDLIIVDTSGRHKQEAALFEEMEQVAAAVNPNEVIFVMDGSIGQAAQSQAAAFKASVAVGSVIVTKLDGHAKGGGALSAVAATGSPIIFLGTGEHFDALEPFEAQRFVGKLLGRGDMQGLVREIKEKGLMEPDAETMRRLVKGKFTLRDMREQFDQVMKLGLHNVADKLPGQMGQLFSGAMAAGGGNDPNTVLRRFMIIMDSMTRKELDGEVEIDESRAIRILRGSGASPEEYQKLMMSYKQYQGMVGGMAKSGLLAGDDRKFLQQMKRDPRAMQNALERNMNPQMLKQFGGVNGMLDMMKKMSEGEGGAAGPGGAGAGRGGGGKGGGGGAGGGGMPPGMPDMEALMSMMGGGAGGGGAGGGGMPDLSAMMSALGGMGGGGKGGGLGGLGGLGNLAKMMGGMGGGRR